MNNDDRTPELARAQCISLLAVATDYDNARFLTGFTATPRDRQTDSEGITRRVTGGWISRHTRLPKNRGGTTGPLLKGRTGVSQHEKDVTHAEPTAQDMEEKERTSVPGKRVANEERLHCSSVSSNLWNVS
nr:PREDICTED: uncharacterized protein LOC105673455 [Linepithema humile]